MLGFCISGLIFSWLNTTLSILYTWYFSRYVTFVNAHIPQMALPSRGLGRGVPRGSGTPVKFRLLSIKQLDHNTPFSEAGQN